MNLVKLHEDTFPLMISKATSSAPREKPVKLKEKVKAATSNPKSLIITEEKSGDIMKLCVNLMPLLAAAKEPMEEEEEKEEDSSCESIKEAETNYKDFSSVTKLEEQTDLDFDAKQPLSQRLVLPPLNETAADLEYRKTKRCYTLLPPIGLSSQTSIISSSITIKSYKPDEIEAEELDSSSWMDKPLLSKSVSKQRNPSY